MPIVDTHCHASLSWFEPIERLVEEMDANGVDHAILIQIRGQFDNSYQAACVRRYPGRFASVVLVDHTRADAVERLEREAASGAVGVRLRADARSPGEDPLLIWRAAERLGLSVSCQPVGAAIASGAIGEVAAAVPRLKIALEHLAGVHSTINGRAAESAKDYHLDTAVLAGAVALARHPNLYVKVPGLGEFCQRAMPVDQEFPFARPIPPVLGQLVEAYGPNRLMWGSDFPPVANREGYANALRLVMGEVDPAHRDAIFGGTALEVFPVRR